MRLEEEIKGHFRSPYHKARINIYYTNSYLSGNFLSSVKKYGLTPVQYNVLRILRRMQPEAVDLKFIRERLLDHHPDVSRLIDRLYRKGWVERKENPGDRREKLIRITRSGLDLIAGMDQCEQSLDQLMEKLSPKEVDTLNQLLDKIRE